MNPVKYLCTNTTRRFCMSHAHSTTKRRTFKHLNAYQRGQIEAMLRLGVTKVKIAKDLGIARSTLYEEIKRGTVAQKRSDWTYYEQYFAQSGQIRYERNRENSGTPSKFNAAQDFIRYVENAILKDKHSPDAICGRAKRMNLFDVSVCTKTIYNYIAMGLLKVKNIDLRQNVRRRKRKEKMILSRTVDKFLTRERTFKWLRQWSHRTNLPLHPRNPPS